MKITYLIVLSFLFVIVFDQGFSESENIMITKSNVMSDVIIDGKWSFNNSTTTEWKMSSTNKVKYDDGSTIVLRSAHQGEYVYFLIDFITDLTIDKMDRAIVCFDTLNDKSLKPNADDYCFMVVQGKNLVHTFQGGSDFATQKYFTKVSNHENLEVVGGISGKFDRYNKMDHSSYEFKIPTDVIGRNNVYGFYFEVFDYSNEKSYLWPENILHGVDVKLQSPSMWGEMISPDKTLAEFSFSLLLIILLPAITATCIITRVKFVKLGFK